MPRCKDILVVEDDEGIRETLQLALELEGYAVTTACNGKEGLAALPLMRMPCLILLDLMMPVMNGWAFAEALRDDQMLAPIPVVIVTAFPDKAAGITQARGVLKKPVELEGLLQMVRRFCG
jgi:CheY-like chemotaxis protein